MKSFKAFTLAEVLVTLVVIGVIAALTIPSLIQNTQDAHLRTQWQKVFSTMSQATNRIISDNSGFTNIDNSTSIKNDYKGYLSVVNEDLSQNLLLPLASYSAYKGGTPEWAYPLSKPALVLSDGTVVVFYSQSNGCTRSNGIQNICGYFVADVNGKNPPNMWGKDLYDAWIVKDPYKGYILLPMGTTGDSYSCVIQSGPTYSSSFSQGCSAKSLLNGPMP